MPDPCILISISLTLFEKFLTFYPGSSHVFKYIMLVVICRKVDKLMSCSSETTAVKTSGPDGFYYRYFYRASHRYITIEFVMEFTQNLKF